MTTITLDYLDSIRVDTSSRPSYHNELQVLGAWQHGLHFLYREVRAMEEAASAEILSELTGNESTERPKSECVFGNLACCFQWYAITLCNYVELVGCIGWELDRSRPPPRKYVDDVVPAVLAYRNKVAAHISRARRSQSNAAERFASLLPPSSLINGRYHAGALMATVRRSGTVSHSGAIQPWSLAETHEAFAPRYWPKQTVKSIETQESGD